ncbi:hypothetical protein NPIL_531981 [Nephila pilipes]|uniref:Uncharacterized protein n=1 Tax=Nephila pilipes TaxID=299642 RepID=A0A8X6PMG5_NEPPI|nr:hypothetical protein NPIL_531981 [Nephila pilipes]
MARPYHTTSDHLPLTMPLCISQETKAILQNFLWEVLEYLPYSPDLSPVSTSLGYFKRGCFGRQVKVVQDFLQNQPQKSFYCRHGPPKRWDLCYNAHDDFFDFQ